METLERVMNEERAWQLVALATGAPAGLAVRQALETGWQD